jgi:hypothetical protein
MFAQTEDRRALFGVIAANAFEDRRAVTYDVGQDVKVRVVPVDPFSVVPNFLGLLNRHKKLPFTVQPLSLQNTAEHPQLPFSYGAAERSTECAVKIARGQNQFGA